MLSRIAAIWEQARRTIRPQRTEEDNPILISPHAQVSADQNGAVFLHACSGVVFTSNRIGARIWQGLRDGEGMEAIAASISRENGVRQDLVRQDAAEFVRELEIHGFLSRRVGG